MIPQNTFKNYYKHPLTHTNSSINLDGLVERFKIIKTFQHGVSLCYEKTQETTALINIIQSD
jgi:hypothetical protein